MKKAGSSAPNLSSKSGIQSSPSLSDSESESPSTARYVSIALQEVNRGRPLPGPIFLYIDSRFILLRAQGDALESSLYERLELKKVQTLFVLEKDREKFLAEAQQLPKAGPVSSEAKKFASSRQTLQRKIFDIFQSTHPEPEIAEAIKASKLLVHEVMNLPFSAQNLANLQVYARSIADHSVNVSVLSTYLAMQMGYSHFTILQNLGVGGLFHDVGKSFVKWEDQEREEQILEKMKTHSSVGANWIQKQDPLLAQEVRMIIEQHHEHFDGTGYPGKLKGNQIYDLARIVSIANHFDHLVTEGQQVSLVERQKAAIRTLDEKEFKRFDPQKLEKCLKILRLGI